MPPAAAMKAEPPFFPTDVPKSAYIKFGLLQVPHNTYGTVRQLRSVI